MLAQLHSIFDYPKREIFIPARYRTFTDVLYLKPCHGRISENEHLLVEKIRSMVVANGFKFEQLTQTSNCNGFGFIGCGSRCKLSKIILAFDDQVSRHGKLGYSILTSLSYGAIPASFVTSINHWMKQMNMNERSFLNRWEYSSDDEFISKGIISSLRNVTRLEEIQQEPIMFTPLAEKFRTEFWKQVKRLLVDGVIVPSTGSMEYLKKNRRFSHLLHRHEMKYCVENPFHALSLPERIDDFFQYLYNTRDVPQLVKNCDDANVRFIWDVLDPDLRLHFDEEILVSFYSFRCSSKLENSV
jgi:hypothetical protein